MPAATPRRLPPARGFQHFPVRRNARLDATLPVIRLRVSALPAATDRLLGSSLRHFLASWLP